jgi:hypothetical protein
MPPRTIKTSSLKAILLISLITVGCASTYKPVSVSSLSYYETKPVNDTLRVGYRYNVQEITNNRRYASKEKKYNMAAVALRIENTSSVPVTITYNNFKIYSGTGEKKIVSPVIYSKKVKQRVGAHMLHALWGPWGISWQSDQDGNSDVSGYYIPAGLIVGIGNAVRASNANRESKATLEVYEIWNKEIAPGKTLHGIVTLSSIGDEPLSFSYGNNAKPDLTVLTPTKRPEVTGALGSATKSLAHDFFVIPVTGKSYSAKTKIYTSSQGHFIIANDPNKGTVQVFPSETKTLSRMTKDDKQLLGIPNGDHWLFKISTGKISTYYFFAEENTKDISHIQKADGEILAFTPQTLIGMVDGDPDAIDLISRGKFRDAVELYNAKNK